MRDFNYELRHRGRKTECEIDANGVLTGTSKKVYRGTIDLVHGCKGATGTERETVLLANKGVDNKTVPVILCDEDDVAGNHGATIAPEEIPLLFERFHKSDKSRSEDKDGYGLGLYVVKTILTQHKEHISVTARTD